ncbi:hypothetical protein ACLOJK_039204 [Asimina triloba]
MANHRISSVFLTLEHQAENPSDCRSEIQARQPSTIFPAPSDPSMVGATAKPTRSSDHGAAIRACLPPISRSRSVAHRRQQLSRPPLARPAISSDSRGPPGQQLDGNKPAAMGCEIPKSSSHPHLNQEGQKFQQLLMQSGSKAAIENFQDDHGSSPLMWDTTEGVPQSSQASSGMQFKIAKGPRPAALQFPTMASTIRAPIPLIQRLMPKPTINSHQILPIQNPSTSKQLPHPPWPSAPKKSSRLQSRIKAEPIPSSVKPIPQPVTAVAAATDEEESLRQIQHASNGSYSSPSRDPSSGFFPPGQQRGQIANRPIDRPSSAKRWAMSNCNKRRFQKAATRTASPFAQRKLQHILTVEGNLKFEHQAYLNRS